MGILGTVRGLALACHPVPTAAVTMLALLLAVGSPARARDVIVVTLAVLSGQLVIGWHNDLVDLDRDLASGRTDKPVAGGEVSQQAVRIALAGALATTALLTLWAGGLPGVLLHVGLSVGSGLAYNAGLKSTVWSWVPYAVAFGALPAFIWLAVGRGSAPWWAVTVGALLGVGAHLLNVLPDLEEDRRAGIRGFPHRIGERPSRVLAPVLLLTGTLVVLLAPAGPPSAWGWTALATATLLAAVALTGRGKTPFLAAIGIAVFNVVGLTLSG